MSKKEIKIKGITFEVKFPEEKMISNYKFKKGDTYKVTLDDVDKKELEHKGELSGIKGKITPKKDKDTDDAPTDLDIEIKGKFDNGYFYDSLNVEELKISGTDYKIEKQSVKTGADLLGVNYWGWGGIGILLALVIVGGYYWWTNYNKEEEEENI